MSEAPSFVGPAAADPRDGLVYVTSPELDLAVDVALAAGRPLLLRGHPGSGKSSLAPYIARVRGWRYYEHVITSRTQTTDLLWSFDAVRRLADAQVLGSGAELDDYRYVEPGALWWAFAPESAARRGRDLPLPEGFRPAVVPLEHINRDRSSESAVVLIDEIDKADPDVPNGLLIPLGSSEFTVTETGTFISAQDPESEPRPRRLIVITTNEERELPQAFLRRCVVATLPDPSDQDLLTIARAHLSHAQRPFGAVEERLARLLADELIAARKEAAFAAGRAPSTAEYLDALRACLGLAIVPGEDNRWELVRRLTLVKPQRPEDGGP
ncbi:AAA family ATPase [Streptomyces sp. NPDC006527]|jgi:MoxR-like ATPase|uniref:AAA family ATPase n=1 Tax=Streptomyces sp. NPDC006527 TaxID=3364749 RepID=UPI0036A05856